jgi:hypothetical protein
VQASSNGSALASCTGSMRQSVAKLAALTVGLGERLDLDTLRAACVRLMFALAARSL